jgi:hypothetical protein
MPKKLPKKYSAEIARIINEVKYYPGIEPDDSSLTKSHVEVRYHRHAFICARLKEEKRTDLIPVVNWLYSQSSPINFYFKSSGRLQARETSVWPVKCIEQWPGWLRTEVFGTVIDLDAAFCQYLMSNLYEKHGEDTRLLELKYPYILKLLNDKEAFRKTIVEDWLKLPFTDANIKLVKSVIMALANGSNCSGALVTATNTRSVVAQELKQHCAHLSMQELYDLGEKFRAFVIQFRNAKRELCIHMFRVQPSREAIKRVFHGYFEWERRARHQIWDLAGRTGLQIHDGLDGVQLKDASTFAEEIWNKHQLRVSIDSPTLY